MIDPLSSLLWISLAIYLKKAVVNSECEDPRPRQTSLTGHIMASPRTMTPDCEERSRV